MAKITTSSLISTISGTVGGQVFRRRPGGFSVYQRKPLLDRAYKSKSLQQIFLADASNRWNDLSLPMKKAWNTLAQTQSISAPWSAPRLYSGRELFFCFYTYARHCLIDLPADWLPTPPLFSKNLSITAMFFKQSLTWDNKPFSELSFSACYFDELDPWSQPIEKSNCYAAVWTGQTRNFSQEPPRIWRKVAPLPGLFPFDRWEPRGYRPSSRYFNWFLPYFETFGQPSYIIPGAPMVTNRFVNYWIKAVALTNERLYFSPPLSCRTYILQNVDQHGWGTSYLESHFHFPDTLEILAPNIPS